MIKLCKIVRNVRFWFLICPKLVGTPGAWWLCTWKLMKDVQFNNWINCSFRHFISNGCTISHGLLLQWLGLSFYQLQKKIQKNRKSKEEGRTSRKFITCEWTNTVQKQENEKLPLRWRFVRWMLPLLGLNSAPYPWKIADTKD